MPKQKRHKGAAKRITREEFDQLVANPFGNAFWGRSPEQILFNPGDIVEMLVNTQWQCGIVLNTPMTMDFVWEEVVKYQWSFGGKPLLPNIGLHDISEDVYKVIDEQGIVVDVAPVSLRQPYNPVPNQVKERLEEHYHCLAPKREEVINKIWYEIHKGDYPIAFNWRDDTTTEYFYDPRTDSIASENGFGVKITRQTAEINRIYIERLIYELENEIAAYFHKYYPYKIW
ncbi:MAG: hypothetical protein NC102_02265 [Clostridium sp.]|nr:hypothetical protein [Clostridium sp.]